jgi:hypothetical protein
MSLVDKFLALGLSKKATSGRQDREEEREEDVMTQELKPGDRVRVKAVTGHKRTVGKVGVVQGPSWYGGELSVRIEGEESLISYMRSSLELVEPEWVVGQQVSGDDYQRLPVGSVVQMHDGDPGNPPWTKGRDGLWTWSDDDGCDLSLNGGLSRTLINLGDGKRTLRQNLIPNPAFKVGTGGWATQPEDATDAYVEPEPLKEGDWCLVWAQFDTVEPDDDGDVTIEVPGSGLGTQYARADAIVRPDAGQVPPWVKPARCTSLHFIADEDIYVRCMHDSPHVGVHGTRLSPGFKQWDDDDARITESGAS